ncbi:MAG: glutathione synthetase [Saprospiraceae bacterium]|nr:glutathione synthetase [Saprospiraceae bacterium]
MGYRVLILIDHQSHNITNSVYQLANRFFLHPKIGEVFVASRSDVSNLAFFSKHSSLDLHAVKVDSGFSFDSTGQQFDHVSNRINLQEMDMVVLRLPHPLDEAFFHFISENFPPEKMINRPQGIIQTGNKLFLLKLQSWCPPIRWCTTFAEIIDFHQAYNLVLKPLRSYGGKGIVRIYDGVLEDTYGVKIPLSKAELFLTDLKRDGYLAMQYLENVHLGDKRIVVVNGKIVGAALRIPAAGSWVCNVSQGGHAEAAFADEREAMMADAIHKVVSPLGIGIFGMDTLVDDNGQRVLSEINTLSVGGFGPMEMQHQKPIPALVADELISFYEQNSK